MKRFRSTFPAFTRSMSETGTCSYGPASPANARVIIPRFEAKLRSQARASRSPESSSPPRGRNMAARCESTRTRLFARSIPSPPRTTLPHRPHAIGSGRSSSKRWSRWIPQVGCSRCWLAPGRVTHAAHAGASGCARCRAPRRHRARAVAGRNVSARERKSVDGCDRRRRDRDRADASAARAGVGARRRSARRCRSAIAEAGWSEPVRSGSSGSRPPRLSLRAHDGYWSGRPFVDAVRVEMG